MLDLTAVSEKDYKYQNRLSSLSESKRTKKSGKYEESEEVSDADMEKATLEFQARASSFLRSCCLPFIVLTISYRPI